MSAKHYSPGRRRKQQPPPSPDPARRAADLRSRKESQDKRGPFKERRVLTYMSFQVNSDAYWMAGIRGRKKLLAALPPRPVRDAQSGPGLCPIGKGLLWSGPARIPVGVHRPSAHWSGRVEGSFAGSVGQGFATRPTDGGWPAGRRDGQPKLENPWAPVAARRAGATCQGFKRGRTEQTGSRPRRRSRS